MDYKALFETLDKGSIVYKYVLLFPEFCLVFMTALFLSPPLAETPPPGYLSEDGETSDHQMNHSMDAGTSRWKLIRGI